MMATYQEAIESTVTTWEGITAAPHQFNAREYMLRVGTRTIEVGHLHGNTLLDILFSVKVRAALLNEGKTDVHHFIPDSGWTSFSIRSQADYEQALWLLRLSYLEKLERYTRGRHNLDIPAELEQMGISQAIREAAFPRLNPA